MFRKEFSLRWWIGNFNWVWKSLVGEVAYCLRYAISLIPGMIGRFFRRRFWGIGSVGKNVNIGEGCWFSHSEKLILGDNVGINMGCMLNANGGLEIGKNTLLGPGVVIWSQNHIYTRRDIPVAKQGYECKRVIIGEDVWIGARAIILPGVRVGKGAVVGAGAVVTGDVASFSIVAGVPARQIKERPENMDALEENAHE
ncbi:acyltransferase [Thermodesulfobacteriota bacterium B35]